MIIKSGQRPSLVKPVDRAESDLNQFLTGGDESSRHTLEYTQAASSYMPIQIDTNVLPTSIGPEDTGQSSSLLSIVSPSKVNIYFYIEIF
jgi:hypothetical protein